MAKSGERVICAWAGSGETKRKKYIVILCMVEEEQRKYLVCKKKEKRISAEVKAIELTVRG